MERGDGAVRDGRHLKLRCSSLDSVDGDVGELRLALTAEKILLFCSVDCPGRLHGGSCSA
jgi:hypothetical protein